jgi:DNA-directed RNA polymerase specialized sigma24 family protein
MMSNPQDSRVAPRHFANFRAPAAAPEPLLRDWLAPHLDTLFRWTIARAGSADERRALAEVAVAIQRLRGQAEFGAWLYGAALQAALQQGQQGGLNETTLTGLPPEMRALLRLVARQELRAAEAMALLAQRMGYVRSRLVRTRLGG